jgi:hypothetical protein
MSTLATVQPHPIGDSTNWELAITRKRVAGSSDNLYLQRVAASAELRTREGTTRRNIAKVIAPSADSQPFAVTVCSRRSIHQPSGLCAKCDIHPASVGAKWLIGYLNPTILGLEEATMLGYGLIGTLVIICLVVWLVRAV